MTLWQIITPDGRETILPASDYPDALLAYEALNIRLGRPTEIPFGIGIRIYEGRYCTGTCRTFLRKGQADMCPSCLDEAVAA